MRYSIGFLCVCAFGLIPLIGCSEAQPGCERAADCNDQDDCTVDTCDPASSICRHAAAADGTSCDFGGAAGVCMAGVCQEDLCAEVECDDQNDCTHDPCNPVDGSCSNSPIVDGTSCDFDGFPGVCRAGVCEEAMLCQDIDCDDLNDCTEDTCDRMDGTCDHDPKPDGTPCNDGVGTCASGICGACTGEADAAVYECLEFTDDDGQMHTGTDAARAISHECARGSNQSIPAIEGCSDELLQVIGCYPRCSEELVEALATCLRNCTQETTAELCPPGLSDGCVECSGDSAACTMALCVQYCVADWSASQCIECRCQNGCSESFETCSGLPSGECGAGGVGGSGGAGGSGGTGGAGGSEGACVNEANAMVYECLEFTDNDGQVHMGTDASSAIAGDCLYGSDTSVPPIQPGCGPETLEVVRCFPSCPVAVIQALASCVTGCTQATTADLCPPGLSNECVECTGGAVACGAAFCTSQCVSDTNSPTCIECRCDNGCTQDFAACSGIPSDECG